MESPGLLLQMDGSPHRWFGDKKSCLIAIIDDATSEVHAEFFDSETTLGCLKVLRDFIAKKGVFKVLYVDKAGIFGGPKRCNFSQVQRACSELGIATSGVDADTVLFGDGSLIDSMALVGLVIKLEEHVLASSGREIQIIDDEAIIADGQTPFRTARTLAAHALRKAQAA